MAVFGWCVQCGKALTGMEYASGHECSMWSGVEGMKISGPVWAFLPEMQPFSQQVDPVPPFEATLAVTKVDHKAKTITLESK